MSIALSDRTVGHLVNPDGSVAVRPTVIFGAETAAIIRAYMTWAITNHLEPELVCATCFDHSRESKAQYMITEQQIAIACQCQIRFFQGATLPPEPVTSSVSVKTTSEGHPGQVLLSEDAARLLRRYKTVLLELGLKEALRCNTCWDLNQEDGCAARVTSNLIEIHCRCSHRIYRGMTV